MEKISSVDKRILYELDLDCRQSLNRLAKKLKINRDTLVYRIKQLENKGIIKGYYTVINSKVLGYRLIRLYLKLQKINPKIEKEIVNYFLNEDKNFTVFKTQGNWDLAIGFNVKKLEEFYEIYNKFKLKFQKYVYDDKISMFVDYLQYPKDYLVDKNKINSEIIFGNLEKVRIDETDEKILRVIAENARIQLVDISKQLNMTSMGIHQRIKNLVKKNVILGYKVLIDLSKLNLEYYKVDFILNDLSKIGDMKNFAKSHPNIVYEDITIGGSDFEIDIEIEPTKINEIIDEFKLKFGEYIDNISYYRADKIYKYNYFPF